MAAELVATLGTDHTAHDSDLLNLAVEVDTQVPVGVIGFMAEVIAASGVDDRYGSLRISRLKVERRPRIREIG